MFKYISNPSQSYQIDLWTVHIASLFFPLLLYSHGIWRSALNDLRVYCFSKSLAQFIFGSNLVRYLMSGRVTVAWQVFPPKGGHTVLSGACVMITWHPEQYLLAKNISEVHKMLMAFSFRWRLILSRTQIFGPKRKAPFRIWFYSRTGICCKLKSQGLYTIQSNLNLTDCSVCISPGQAGWTLVEKSNILLRTRGVVFLRGCPSSSSLYGSNTRVNGLFVIVKVRWKKQSLTDITGGFCWIPLLCKALRSLL